MSEFRDQVSRHATYGSVKSWRERHGRYRLMGSRCSRCHAIAFPRRPSCHRCQCRKMEPYQCSHTGTVVSVWPQVNLVRLLGYADLPQRFVGIVQLDDGVHIETELVDITSETARVGLRVHLVFRRLRREGNGNEMYGYKFAPSQEPDESQRKVAETTT